MSENKYRFSVSIETPNETKRKYANGGLKKQEDYLTPYEVKKEKRRITTYPWGDELPF